MWRDTDLTSRLNIPGLTGSWLRSWSRSWSSSWSRSWSSSWSSSSPPMCCIDPEGTSSGGLLPLIVFSPGFCRCSSNAVKAFCGRRLEWIKRICVFHRTGSRMDIRCHLSLNSDQLRLRKCNYWGFIHVLTWFAWGCSKSNNPYKKSVLSTWVLGKTMFICCNLSR